MKELIALKSLHSWDGIVIVWKADLYWHDALLHNDPTINNFVQASDLLASAYKPIQTTPRTPVMYFLPKIHKPNNPGRPIISSCSCPTELISSFLDVMFPLVKKLSYIQDTNNALQMLDQIGFTAAH